MSRQQEQPARAQAAAHVSRGPRRGCRGAHGVVPGPDVPPV